MKYLYLSLLMVLWGCSSHQIEHPRTGPVFKDGIYHHHVEVYVSPINQKINLKGVFSKQKKIYKLIGLGPFNNTLLSIVDDTDAKFKMDIYDKSIEKYKSKIENIYLLVKKIFLIDYSELHDKTLKLSDLKGEIKFSDYDEYFRTIKVFSEKYQIDISITKYEKVD